jgi:hypothetical protein
MNPHVNNVQRRIRTEERPSYEYRRSPPPVNQRIRQQEPFHDRRSEKNLRPAGSVSRHAARAMHVAQAATAGSCMGTAAIKTRATQRSVYGNVPGRKMAATRPTRRFNPRRQAGVVVGMVKRNEISERAQRMDEKNHERPEGTPKNQMQPSQTRRSCRNPSPPSTCRNKWKKKWHAAPAVAGHTRREAGGERRAAMATPRE